MLSDQLIKKKRLGIDVHMRGLVTRSRKVSNNSNYAVSLYELLKSYSNHTMRKNFLSINISKLSACSTEQGIKIIKDNMQNLINWKNVYEFVPSQFRKNYQLKKSGIAGLFCASLELTKEGIIDIMQKHAFDKLLVKEKK